jgi:hypothetical protein
MMSYAEIYQRFLKFCRSYSLGGLWRDFQGPLDLWSPPADSSAALAALRQQFDDSELRKAGIVSGDSDDMVVLNPILRDPQTTILALREQAENAPFELVVDQGCLSGRLPVCAAMQDRRVQQAVTEAGALVLTFCMEDLAALRQVGIPAMSVHGLADIRREALTEFCRCLQKRRLRPYQQKETPHMREQDPGISAEQRGPTQESEAVTEPSLTPTDRQVIGTPPELIFAAWSPARLELVEPGGFQDIASHFAAIEEYVEIFMYDVYVWHPGQEDLDRVRFCLQNGDREAVREALLASMDASVAQINAPAPVYSAPKNLSEAIVQLENVLHSPAPDEDLEKRAWEDYEEQVNSELAMPLLQLAMTVVEPVEQNLMAAAATITRVLHPQAMLVAAKITKGIGKSGFGEISCVRDKDVKNLLQMTDRLIGLNEELWQCKQKKKTRPKSARL